MAARRRRSPADQGAHGRGSRHIGHIRGPSPGRRSSPRPRSRGAGTARGCAPCWPPGTRARVGVAAREDLVQQPAAQSSPWRSGSTPSIHRYQCGSCGVHGVDGVHPRRARGRARPTAAGHRRQQPQWSSTPRLRWPGGQPQATPAWPSTLKVASCGRPMRPQEDVLVGAPQALRAILLARAGTTRSRDRRRRRTPACGPGPGRPASGPGGRPSRSTWSCSHLAPEAVQQGVHPLRAPP
jgi:hypothetical protein